MPFGIRFKGRPGGIREEKPAKGKPKEKPVQAEAESLEVPKGVSVKKWEPEKGRKKEKEVRFVPIRVSKFDDLVERRGVERGTTLLVSGGCGTGKSTFCMQSIYNGIMNGEKAVYIVFEESPVKLKRHMQRNFGWDLDKLEREGKLAILKINPFKIARSVEASLIKQRRALLVQVEQLELPFIPDRIVVDSLSALSVAFMGNNENYRYYIKHMFDSLDQYDSVNFVISETEQDPGVYSRTGIEEFLADGVVVLYNIKVGRSRERGLEILKLRCSNHEKRLVPYQITKTGIEILSEKALKDKGFKLK